MEKFQCRQHICTIPRWNNEMVPLWNAAPTQNSNKDTTVSPLVNKVYNCFTAWYAIPPPILIANDDDLFSICYMENFKDFLIFEFFFEKFFLVFMICFDLASKAVNCLLKTFGGLERVCLMCLGISVCLNFTIVQC